MCQGESRCARAVSLVHTVTAAATRQLLGSSAIAARFQAYKYLIPVAVGRGSCWGASAGAEPSGGRSDRRIDRPALVCAAVQQRDLLGGAVLLQELLQKLPHGCTHARVCARHPTAQQVCPCSLHPAPCTLRPLLATTTRSRAATVRCCPCPARPAALPCHATCPLPTPSETI